MAVTIKRFKKDTVKLMKNKEWMVRGIVQEDDAKLTEIIFTAGSQEGIKQGIKDMEGKTINLKLNGSKFLQFKEIKVFAKPSEIQKVPETPAAAEIEGIKERKEAFKLQCLNCASMLIRDSLTIEEKAVMNWKNISTQVFSLAHELYEKGQEVGW